VNVHQIDDYRFGQITVGGKTYHKDVIILPDRLINGWWRERGHYLIVRDLDVINFEELEILIVGLGAYNRMQVSEEVCSYLNGIGIQLIALPSREACDQFNELNGHHKVAAAIHLTC
jgi:hypothetical protein